MSDATLQFDRMLNPGFCGLLVSGLVEGASRGLPLVVTYLLVPMLLHRRTVERLHNASSHGLGEFVHQHPDIIIGIDKRIRMTVPNTRAGITVALRRGAIHFVRQTGILVATGAIRISRPRLRELLSPEDDRRVSASLKLGKWAGSMSVSLICDALAVRPAWGQNEPTVPATTLSTKPDPAL